METQLGKPQTLSITAKLYLQVFCKHQLVGCCNNQYFQLQLKDAPTPCLLERTGRKLRIPTGFCFLPLLLPTTFKWLCVLYFLYTLWFETCVYKDTLFEWLDLFLYTLNCASLPNSHNYSSRSLTNKTNLELPSLLILRF